MPNITPMGSANIEVENGVKFIELSFVDLFALTSDYSLYSVGFYNSKSGEKLNKNNAHISIANDYLFSFVKNAKSCCSIKIDNNEPLSIKQIIVAETLSKLFYYRQLTQTNSALKKQIMNRLALICSNEKELTNLSRRVHNAVMEAESKFDQIIEISPDLDISIKDEPLTEKEVKQLVDYWDSLELQQTKTDPVANLKISHNGIILNQPIERE